MIDTIQTVLRAITMSVVPLLAFETGISLSTDDLRREIHNPLLVRALVAALIVAPAVAILLALLLPAHPIAEGVIVLMAVSPGAPFLLNATSRRDANKPLGVVLAMILTLAAIALVPIELGVLRALFPYTLHASPGALFVRLVPLLIPPFVLGLAIRWRWPARAETIQSVARVSFQISLAVSIAASLFLARHVFTRIGAWDWFLMLCVTIANIAIGRIAGGRDPHDARTVTYAVALGNPAIALLVAATSYPDLKLAPAIVGYVIIRAALLMAYKFAVRHRTRGIGATATG